VLSGDIDTNDANADGNGIAESTTHVIGNNSHHVLVIGGTAATGNGVYTATDTVIDGIVLTAGQANGGTVPHDFGGGLFCNGAGAGKECSPRLENVTLSGNAAGLGGALFNAGNASGRSNTSLVNVTFSGNRASTNGGAMYNSGASGESSPSLTHATFMGNSAGASGGAVHSSGSGAIPSRPAFRGAIFWGNTATLGGAQAQAEGNAQATFADTLAEGGCPNDGTGGAACSGALLLADPQLGPLQMTGGVTPTHVPAAPSPVVDAMACAPVAIDQRSVPRPQGARCDIGAVERHVCRVTPSAASTGTDGGNWTTRARGLPSALAENTCDEIWLKQGRYTPTTTGDRTLSFAIERRVRLHGGFAGDETTLAARHASAPSVLSGDIDNNDSDANANGIAESDAHIVGNNSLHVVTIGGPGDNPIGSYTPADTVLDRIVITAGLASPGKGAGFADLGRGAGLFCNGNCSPRLSAITFSGNRAEYGGAMYTVGIASPQMVNLTFSGNRAYQGGAIYTQGYSGGGVPTLSNVTFRANHAESEAGAVYVLGARDDDDPATLPVFRGVLFSGNTAPLGPDVLNANRSSSTFTDTIAEAGCPSAANGACAGVLIVADPLLGPLQENGGATLTHLPGTGSPAIDAMACLDAVEDQRGIVRPQGVKCDIGAVEIRVSTSDGVPVFRNGFEG
jgi:predicted outer membrane repeat protein